MKTFAFYLTYEGTGHVSPGRWFNFQDEAKAKQQRAIYAEAGATVTQVTELGIFSDHLVPWSVPPTTACIAESPAP